MDSKTWMGLESIDSTSGAPTQIRKWGDNYGERSEPKKFYTRGEIIHPETAKLAMLE